MVTIADRTEIAPRAVLFDPAALEGFFAEEPEPGLAFRKFPDRLDREIECGNAFPSRRFGVDVRVGEFTPPPDAEEVADEAGLLRVPSGRIFVAGAKPPVAKGEDAEVFLRTVAEVSPGDYRVRTFRRRWTEDRRIELEASSRMSGEDQAALQRFREVSRYELVLLPLAVLLLGLPLAGMPGSPFEVVIGVAVALFLVLVPLPFGIVTASRKPVRSLRKRYSAEVAAVRAELREAWGEATSILLIEPEAETS